MNPHSQRGTMDIETMTVKQKAEIFLSPLVPEKVFNKLEEEMQMRYQLPDNFYVG